MALTIERSEGSVKLRGELDIASEKELMSALEPDIERGGDLLLDLEDLSFIDSSGVRTILRAAERLGDRGSVVVRSPTGAVLRVFELMRLDTAPNVRIAEGPG